MGFSSSLSASAMVQAILLDVLKEQFDLVYIFPKSMQYVSTSVLIKFLQLVRPRGYKTCFILNSAEQEI